MKLLIGDYELPGYVSVSKDVRPLIQDDETADEIYASYVLQLFRREEVPAILRDWVRVLKPGGELWISVPNIHEIPIDTEGWEDAIFGTEPEEMHKCCFTPLSLISLMNDAKLEMISPWSSGNQDKSQLPWSLSLVAVKKDAISEGLAQWFPSPAMETTLLATI